MVCFNDIFLDFWNFRFLPLRYRWRLVKYRRRLMSPSSGLALMYSIQHARKLTSPPQSNPYFFVMKLLWPFPYWYLPAKFPAKPRVIMDNPEIVDCQERDLMYLRSMPLWRLRDTPERAFYRLYEAVCANNGHMITYETEYFWRQSSPRWATVNIPDPKCDDTEQCAVMASLVEELVDSFTWRLELGLRRNDRAIMNRYIDPPPMVLEVCPAWAPKVPRLQEKLLIQPDEDVYFESAFQPTQRLYFNGSFQNCIIISSSKM